jgi:hypothetical protein
MPTLRNLLTSCALAKDWSEEKRYHRIDRTEAEALDTAIADGAHGVLPWIKTQWRTSRPRAAGS